MHELDEVAGAHHLVRPRIDQLISKLGLFLTGTEQTKAERDILATRILELQVAAATGDGEFGFVMQDEWSLKSGVAAGEDRASMVKVRLTKRWTRCTIFERCRKTESGRWVGVCRIGRGRPCRMDTSPACLHCRHSRECRHGRQRNMQYA